MLANIPAGILLRWWRPRPHLWAVSLLLVVVTGFTGLAPTSEWLIAARLLAGVLGGAAITIGFAILVAGAPPARRGRVMATVTAVQMSAGAIGSFLGGLVLTWFPLEVVFLVAGVPLALVLAWDAVRPAAHYWLPRGRAAPHQVYFDKLSTASTSSTDEMAEPHITRATDANGAPHTLVEPVETPRANPAPQDASVEPVETPRANLSSHPAASAPPPLAPSYAGVGAVAGPLVALAVYDANGLWPAILVIVGLLLIANLSLARLLLRRRRR